MNTQELTQHLLTAFQHASSIRPKVGGFPVLAEVLRQAGVVRNVWTLPSRQSIYVMEQGTLVNQGEPLVTGMAAVPAYDEAAFIAALRADQNGETVFPQFLTDAWNAGVIGYEVDFVGRTCTYFGVNGEHYVESYPAVEIPLSKQV